jgi:seryl-tRNA synthetase
MAKLDLYRQAHLWVAAIRILEHQHQLSPTVDAICDFLGFTTEQGHRLVRKLESRDILQVVVKGTDVHCAIADHRLLEELPQVEAELPPLSAEVAQFQAARNEISTKVAEFKSEQNRKQKDLFAELNAKLKADISRKT